MKRLAIVVVAVAGAIFFATGGAIVGATPPTGVCMAPPLIRSINPTSIAEPQTAGEFNTGTFHVHGMNLEQGQIFTDGPLLLVGDTFVNPMGLLAKRDFSSGSPAPIPGETFNIFLVTPCGIDSISVLITG